MLMFRPSENDRMFEIQQMFWTNPADARLQRILQVCWAIRETNAAHLSPQERLIAVLSIKYMHDHLLKVA
jgi:hypothetical protein